MSRRQTKAELQRELKNAQLAADAFVRAAVDAVKELLAMLDASRFGGRRTYRCLTEREEKRLEEIRKLVA